MSVLPAVEIETAPRPEAAIIWLHGLGADGHDFEPVVDQLGAAHLPPLRFVFPHAPFRAVTINGGMRMRAWYDITSIDFDQRREDEAGIRASSNQLSALMARENERGIADERIVLAGFSQGGAIVLHCGLRHPRRLAGILALSTYLPLAATLGAEAQDANHHTPMFLAHGWSDGVIPFHLGQTSAQTLLKAGYAVDWHAYAMEHGVCLEELAAIGDWLAQVL
jgi:phospholipase/carboxylesterase